MQPLDVSFLFPLKTYYASAIENWLANHPNRIVRKLQVASLFAEAYNRAATVQNAINSFRKTGIAPFKPDIFTEADFLAHHLENEQAIREDELLRIGETSVGLQTTEQTTPVPVTASVTNNSSCHEKLNTESSKSPVVSPTDIQKIPVIGTPTTSKRRNTAFLVTGSPHKKKIFEAHEKQTIPSTSGTGTQEVTRPGPKMKLQVGKTPATGHKKRASQPSSFACSKRKKVEVESSSKSENSVTYM